MSKDVFLISETGDAEYHALVRFRRALRLADIQVFDELLAKAEAHFPEVFKSGPLHLSHYVLCMQMVVIEELKQLGSIAPLTTETEGRTLPFACPLA